ncbi:MAG: helix-turn-helix domain-containing protein [Clostridium sp.]|nr:helix-turn-helix domain-containing protein [Clostridium sp.]
MKIGESIFNIRKEQDMTQEEFASIFAVTRQTVSNWEKEKSYPDLQTLVDMSDRFEVSLDSMLKENADMVKKMDRERKFSKYLKRGILLLA